MQWQLQSSCAQLARLCGLTCDNAGAQVAPRAWRRHCREGAAKERAANISKGQNCSGYPIGATRGVVADLEVVLWWLQELMLRHKARNQKKQAPLHQPRDLCQVFQSSHVCVRYYLTPHTQHHNSLICDSLLGDEYRRCYTLSFLNGLQMIGQLHRRDDIS